MENSVGKTCSSSSERQKGRITTRYEESLIQMAMKVLSLPQNSDDGPLKSASSHERLFRYILKNHIQYSSPLFYMPGDVEIGKEFGLHFFEPRYRLLISEVMSPYPAQY